METTQKEKVKRDCTFVNVKDPNTKNEILKIVKCPNDATNFIFWYSQVEPDTWGLTIKSIPKKGDKEGKIKI